MFNGNSATIIEAIDEAIASHGKKIEELKAIRRELTGHAKPGTKPGSKRKTDKISGDRVTSAFNKTKAKKGSRRMFTEAEKKQLIKKVTALSKTMQVKEACEKSGISESLFYRWRAR